MLTFPTGGKRDPIIALMETFQADTRADKVNLGIGVYQDAAGNTPIFDAVKQAEKRILESEATKSYVGVGGRKEYVKSLADRLFAGADLDWRGVQGVGGSGALRVIIETAKQAKPDMTVWISKPTWANHFAICEAVGLATGAYAWAWTEPGSMVERVLADLEGARPGDLVVLHACCHNPSGVDLDDAQYDRLLDELKARDLVPLFDAAYLGFARSFEADAAALAERLAKFDLAFCAFSASKNFALYRERIGAAFVVGTDAANLDAVHAIFLNMARANYSMPPDHGAAIVGTILDDAGLTQSWLDELKAAHARLAELRQAFGDALAERQLPQMGDLVREGAGLFAMLPLSAEQMQRLRTDHGIYGMDSGRINVAGLRTETIPAIADAVAQVARA